MNEPYAYIIYTDGNTYDNPGGSGGIAGVLEYPPVEKNWKKPYKIFGKGFFHTTNNRMELRAVIEALIWIRKNAKQMGYPNFVIYSDSNYVVDHQYNALIWSQNKWRNRNNKPINNSKLWKEFLNRRNGVSARIKKIRGKSNEIGRFVDKLAKEHGKKPKIEDLGYRFGRYSKSRSGKGPINLFPADNRTYTINHISDKEIIKDEFEVVFDLFSVEDEIYVGKYRAFINRPLVNSLHRGNHFDVTFNNDKKHPLILDVAENIDL